MLLLRQVPIREGDKIVGTCDLISERAWRYREGQTSALIEIPDTVMEREKEARTELLEHFSEFDDWLLEELIEDRAPANDTIYAISTRLLKEKEYAKLEARGGVMDGARLTPEQVEAVSKWPSRAEQLSLLVGQILSPGATLCGQLGAAGGALASQIKQKGEEPEGGAAAPEAPAAG